MKKKGIVASGHSETSRADAEILRAGGNAYAAVMAASCAAMAAAQSVFLAGFTPFSFTLTAGFRSGDSSRDGAVVIA
ncbi:MAG: hypothetical protein SH820_02850 [Xanthomonadales bacterium]|nr:hypothetical protein [Xanthomonadales bacterium]